MTPQQKPWLVLGFILCNLIAVARADSEFEVKFQGNALTGLKARRGAAEYIQTNRSLGDVIVRWRAGGTNWLSTTNGETGKISVQSQFAVQDRAIVWTVQLRNLSD